MTKKKLKAVFILCVLVLIVLIFVTSCNNGNVIQNNNEENRGDTNVAIVKDLGKYDYNNLTEEQKNEIRSKYEVINFTDEGLKIYDTVDKSKLKETITSKWPENEIGKFIPEATYSELDKIEYGENFINVFFDGASKGDAKDYLKKLKKADFKENQKTDDGKAMLQYTIYNENGDRVIVRYMKASKKLEIRAEKN